MTASSLGRASISRSTPSGAAALSRLGGAPLRAAIAKNADRPRSPRTSNWRCLHHGVDRAELCPEAPVRGAAVGASEPGGPHQLSFFLSRSGLRSRGGRTGRFCRGPISTALLASAISSQLSPTSPRGADFFAGLRLTGLAAGRSLFARFGLLRGRCSLRPLAASSVAISFFGLYASDPGLGPAVGPRAPQIPLSTLAMRSCRSLAFLEQSLRTLPHRSRSTSTSDDPPLKPH